MTANQLKFKYRKLEKFDESKSISRFEIATEINENDPSKDEFEADTVANEQKSQLVGRYSTKFNKKMFIQAPKGWMHFGHSVKDSFDNPEAG